METPNVPSAPEVHAWHVAVHERGDRRARAQLVAEYRPNAIALAQRLHRDREPLEDLVQVALEALLLAIDRFDPTRGMPFLGFANPTIVGTIKRHYRDRGWSMRVPRRVHDLAGPIRAGVTALQQDLGREPTVDEVADLLDLEAAEVRSVLLAVQVRSTDSTDVVDDDGRVLQAPSVELGFEEVEVHDQLARAKSKLPEPDRTIIDLYFEDELTQRQIGDRVGCSQMQVSRILSRSVEALRTSM